MNTAHGRQMGKTLDEIEFSHKARYDWVTEIQGKESVVLDAACGCGYGSFILAQQEMVVTGIDIDQMAIDHANKFFGNYADFHCRSIEDFCGDIFTPIFDAIVSFETIEHLKDPRKILTEFASLSDTLYLSVPDEERYPFEETKPLGHVRHYTYKEIEILLKETGWNIRTSFGQDKGKRPKTDYGRFIVIEAKKNP